MQSILTVFGVAMLSSFSAQAQATDPSAAASPHQQSVTGSSATPQSANPAAASPGYTVTPHQKAVMGAADVSGGAQFVTKASQAGMAEVALSKLALSKATDSQVKSFANQMIQDHTKANGELKTIASKSGMSVASALDPEHAAKLRDLGQKSGKAFDQAYIQQMSADHEEAVNLFEQETHDSHADLASFAGETLPVLQHHKQMVASLAKN